MGDNRSTTFYLKWLNRQSRPTHASAGPASIDDAEARRRRQGRHSTLTTLRLLTPAA